MATFGVSRAMKALARPGTALLSWISDGTPASFAPTIAGVDGYPPIPTTTSTPRRLMRRAAWVPERISCGTMSTALLTPCNPSMSNMNSS